MRVHTRVLFASLLMSRDVVLLQRLLWVVKFTLIGTYLILTFRVKFKFKFNTYTMDTQCDYRDSLLFTNPLMSRNVIIFTKPFVIAKMYTYRYKQTRKIPFSDCNQGNKWSGQLRKITLSLTPQAIKTLFRDHMVRLKIISIYIYKDLRLKTIITRMAT